MNTEKKNMYRVMIVEDEPLECIVLEEILKTQYTEIEKIDIAANGIDALKMAQEYMPDILLVDINVPVISGLEVIKQLHKHQFEGEILIVTAYDSFQYAKEAMRYGAVGYLLKPIQDQELYEYMEQCMARIDKRRGKIRLEEQLSQGIASLCSYAQSYLMHDFLKGNVPESALSYAYGYQTDGELQCRMIKIQFEEEIDVEKQNRLIQITEEILSPVFRMLSLVEEKTSYFLLQPFFKQKKEYLDLCTWALGVSVEKQILDEFPKGKITLTKVCSSYEELQREIAQWTQTEKKDKTKQENEQCIEKTWQEFFLWCPVQKSNLFNAHEKKMRGQKAIQRMREGNGSRVVRIYKSYLESEQTMCEGIYLLMKALLQYDRECDLADLVMAVDTEHVEESLESWFLEKFQREENNKNEKDLSPVIRTALAMMQEEYDSPNLSQAELSERLGLSQAYFCRLFKKETGKNFVAVLTEIRMNHAKELLESGIAPEQAAVQCGYPNKKYFYDSFRQRFGMTVLQYQKTKRGTQE